LSAWTQEPSTGRFANAARLRLRPRRVRARLVFTDTTDIDHSLALARRIAYKPSSDVAGLQRVSALSPSGEKVVACTLCRSIDVARTFFGARAFIATGSIHLLPFLNRAL
jgi:hypothetical protein